MASKTSTRVFIGGKLLTLAGYEQEEYLQRVAAYLNRKIAEIEEAAGYKRMTPDLKSTMLALNIADDYYKAKGQAENLEEDLENREKDAYDTKQDLVSAQIEMEKLKADNAALALKVSKLENELMRYKGKNNH